jgi:signal transduction histidine kinase
MRSFASRAKIGNSRLELAMLLVASIACVLVLTINVSDDRTSLAPETIGLNALLTMALAATAFVAAVASILSAFNTTRRAANQRNTEVQDLRRRLASAEALIRAEPQILVHWEQGRGLEIVAQSLTGIPGLPTSQQELLRFGMWMEQKSAADLKTALDALFAEGRAFNMILRTIAGGHIEADGRAAGSRAILRLRDVAGYKRDLGLILDHQKKIGRDVRSSRALLNALPNPAWLRDGSGRLTWVNGAYVKAVEAESEAEVIASQIELLESRQRRAIERMHKQGNPFEDKLGLIVGGHQKTHQVVVLPLAEASAGVAIDIAALESAQNALDRQIAAYDRTLDRVATAVAIFSADRRLTFHNEAYRGLWQLDEDWLKSGPLDGAILDRLRDDGRLPDVANYREWKSRLLACYSEQGEIEDWWHLKDGRVVHVVGERRPDGGVTYFYDDRTESLSLERRYVALTRVQGETLNSLKEGVAVFGTDGRLKLFNIAFAKIWRMSQRQLASTPHIDEFVSNARVLFDDGHTWEKLVKAITSFTTARAQLEGQMLRPDGSVIDYAATPLPDGATLLTFADVTDAKAYERTLQERNEALVAADRLKNRFIGHVSYELRTPLTSIIGFGELLASPTMGELSPRQREYLDHIAQESKKLLSTIDGILDLATIDAGALELRLDEVDPRHLIDATILALRERAVAADLTIDLGIQDGIGTFVADEARVRQILYNLMSNAIGFSRPGGVVKLDCRREAGEIYFVVEDNGVGIPYEQQPRVFDRFESRSQGSDHRGTGLGLSLVKSLVELHRGRVMLDSKPGIGTRVTVRLPERPAGPTPTVEQDPRAFPHAHDLDARNG